MTLNLSAVRPQATPVWVWPPIAPVLPAGFPQGAFTLIRVPTTRQGEGLFLVDDMVSSIVRADQRLFLSTATNQGEIGHGRSPLTATVLTAMRIMALGLRLSEAQPALGQARPEVLAASVASSLAARAARDPRAATVGVWWHAPDDDEDARCIGAALVDIARVVIDVAESDAGTLVLNLSSRTSLGDPLRAY